MTVFGISEGKSSRVCNCKNEREGYGYSGMQFYDRIQVEFLIWRGMRGVRKEGGEGVCNITSRSIIKSTVWCLSILHIWPRSCSLPHLLCLQSALDHSGWKEAATGMRSNEEEEFTMFKCWMPDISFLFISFPLHLMQSLYLSARHSSIEVASFRKIRK